MKKYMKSRNDVQEKKLIWIDIILKTVANFTDHSFHHTISIYDNAKYSVSN